jgi:hypothetical protein
MPDRYIVRREQLGDNEVRYAVWDTIQKPERIRSMFWTKAAAKRQADGWNVAACAVPQADGATE